MKRIIWILALCGVIAILMFTAHQARADEELTITVQENADGTTDRFYRFPYGVLAGRDKKRERFRPDGQIAFITETIYNEQNVPEQNITLTTDYNAMGNPTGTRRQVTILHTEEGRIRGRTKTIEAYNAAGQLVNTRNFTYDDLAREIQVETIVNDRVTQVIRREYNAEGHLARTETLVDDKLTQLNLREYNAEGRLAKEEFFAMLRRSGKPDELISTGVRLTTYLENGRIDKTEDYRDGKLISTSKSTYDDEGRRTIETIPVV